MKIIIAVLWVIRWVGIYLPRPEYVSMSYSAPVTAAEFNKGETWPKSLGPT